MTDALEGGPAKSRHDVFLSHSSKNKVVADTVCAVLERRGIRCWIAPRDIMPGQEWAQAIIRGISDCRVFVLIFSSSSNASSQVRREVERAANSEKPIIPFRIDDIPAHESLEFFISSPHWLDALNPPLESHCERLAEVVESFLWAQATPEDRPDAAWRPVAQPAPTPVAAEAPAPAPTSRLRPAVQTQPVTPSPAVAAAPAAKPRPLWQKILFWGLIVWVLWIMVSCAVMLTIGLPEPTMR